MALQKVGGRGLLWPGLMPEGMAATPNLSSASAMTVSGAQIALMGTVRFAGGYAAGTKNLQSVEFLAGAITVGTGTTNVQVSAQGISTSAGAPSQPDGTILGATNNAKVAPLITAYTASAWNAPGNFGEVAAVSWGQKLSVVFSYSAFGTGPSFTIQGVLNASTAQLPAVSTFNGTTWSTSSTCPNVVLNFDDATVGTLEGAFVVKSFTNTASFNSGSSPLQYGMPFTVPFNCKIDGLWLCPAYVQNTAAGTLAIFDTSGNVVGSASATLDGHQGTANSTGGHPVFADCAETALTVGTQYYLGYKATGAGNIQLATMTVNNNSHFGLHDGGTGYTYSTFSGSWAAATTTQRLLGGVRISQLDDGVSAGGGGFPLAARVLGA